MGWDVSPVRRRMESGSWRAKPMKFSASWVFYASFTLGSTCFLTDVLETITENADDISFVLGEWLSLMSHIRRPFGSHSGLEAASPLSPSTLSPWKSRCVFCGSLLDCDSRLALFTLHAPKYGRIQASRCGVFGQGTSAKDHVGDIG